MISLLISGCSQKSIGVAAVVNSMVGNSSPTLEKADWSKMYKLFGGRVVEGIFDQYLTVYGKTQSGDYTFDTPELKNQVYQMFAVVNPNSKHKEEAVAYLEYICQTGQIQGNPMLYASEKYSEMTAFIEERMVSNFDRRIKATEVYPILWEYLDGEITEEELIDRLTKGVNMQVNE